MGNIIITESLVNNDSAELNAKQQEYLDYINEHIGNVKKAYQDYFVTLINTVRVAPYSNKNLFCDREFTEAVLSIEEDINNHDSSKFGDEEFDAYRSKYHQTSFEKAADEETQKILTDRAEEAWVHHYTNNDHHPKYWVDNKTGQSRDMSLGAIIHMLCDWIAMGMKFGTSTREWYEKEANDEKEVMTGRTKAILEEILYNVLDVE